jgi:hypothetical protein
MVEAKIRGGRTEEISLRGCVDCMYGCDIRDSIGGFFPKAGPTGGVDVSILFPLEGEDVVDRPLFASQNRPKEL